VVSAYGSHLIRVVERRVGRIPALPEVHDAVAREWSNTKRKELENARLSELLKKYRITIETSTGASAPQ
jgi:parvulin-like peptidyl-prolyl isomerase